MSHFIFEIQIYKLLPCQIQFNIDFYLSDSKIDVFHHYCLLLRITMMPFSQDIRAIKRRQVIFYSL